MPCMCSRRTVRILSTQPLIESTYGTQAIISHSVTFLRSHIISTLIYVHFRKIVRYTVLSAYSRASTTRRTTRGGDFVALVRREGYKCKIGWLSQGSRYTRPLISNHYAPPPAVMDHAAMSESEYNTKVEMRNDEKHTGCNLTEVGSVKPSTLPETAISEARQDPATAVKGPRLLVIMMCVSATMVL